MLTNEKYIGNNIFNRHSYKLKERHVYNPVEEWVRADGAFDAIVDPRLFFTAQGMIRERNRRFSDDEMLDRLRDLLKKEGHLSGFVIDEADNLPSSGCYASRFGSLVRAYSLVGFMPDRDYRYVEINRTLRRIHADEVATGDRRNREARRRRFAGSVDGPPDRERRAHGLHRRRPLPAHRGRFPALEDPPRHRGSHPT